MMMRYLLFFFFIITSANAQQHCGFDFTSYIVLHIHEDGKKENIASLKVTLVDSEGQEAVNTDNKYSWNKTGETLVFSENYRIGSDGKRLSVDAVVEKARWFFPYATDTYLLSVTNEFPADDMMVKIEDENIPPVYKSATIQLYTYNMYVLCSSQLQQNAMQFGRKANKPIDVVLEKL
ncbi:MAG TPA: hypothetical protein VF581_04190 [Flavobacterium sp.]|jgi:hypothetical protein